TAASQPPRQAATAGCTSMRAPTRPAGASRDHSGSPAEPSPVSPEPGLGQRRRRLALAAARGPWHRSPDHGAGPGAVRSPGFPDRLALTRVLGELFQQPFRQHDGRVRILPGDQVAVLDHVRLPDRGAAELDADLVLDLGLEQPGRPRGEPDSFFLVIGEAGDPVALERRYAADPGGQDRGRAVA